MTETHEHSNQTTFPKRTLVNLLITPCVFRYLLRTPCVCRLTYLHGKTPLCVNQIYRVNRRSDM